MLKKLHRYHTKTTLILLPHKVVLKSIRQCR